MLLTIFIRLHPRCRINVIEGGKLRLRHRTAHKRLPNIDKRARRTVRHRHADRLLAGFIPAAVVQIILVVVFHDLACPSRYIILRPVHGIHRHDGSLRLPVHQIRGGITQIFRYLINGIRHLFIRRRVVSRVQIHGISVHQNRWITAIDPLSAFIRFYNRIAALRPGKRHLFRLTAAGQTCRHNQRCRHHSITIHPRVFPCTLPLPAPPPSFRRPVCKHFLLLLPISDVLCTEPRFHLQITIYL